MGDFKSLPPRQADFRINLNYKDLSSLMKQAAQSQEVLTFLTTEELNSIIENLHMELNARENENVSAKAE